MLVTPTTQRIIAGTSSQFVHEATVLVIKLAVFVYERKAALVWRKPYDASRQKRLFVNAFTCTVYVGIMTRKEFPFLTSTRWLPLFYGNG